MTKIKAIEYHLMNGELLTVKMFGEDLDINARAEGNYDLLAFKDMTFQIPLDKVAYIKYIHEEEPCSS